MAKYYLAKLNISRNIFADNMQEIKNQLIPEKIMSFKDNELFYSNEDNSNELATIEWTFSDIDTLSDNVISGNIAKQQRVKRTQIQSGRSITSTEDAAKLAHFFYLISDELLLVQSNSDIKYSSSISIFKKLLLLNDPTCSIGDIKIELLSNQNKAVEKFISEKVLEIKLQYSVPNDPRTLNGISDLLLNLKANEGKFQAHNEDGLKSEKNGKLAPLFKDIIQIAEKGFGSWKAKVGDTKNPTMISSKDYPITKVIHDSLLKDAAKIEAIVKEMKESGKSE